MPAYQLQQLCEKTKSKLKEAIEILETFLNHTMLSVLNPDNNPEMNAFYRDLLADLRQLIVFAELDYEKLSALLRRPVFNEEHAEKVLYETYHSCVNAFFFPKNECYSEEGRYAYTGQDAIRFRKKPKREVRDVIVSLSKIFEELREDLSYYETDYVTQRRLKGEKI